MKRGWKSPFFHERSSFFLVIPTRTSHGNTTYQIDGFWSFRKSLQIITGNFTRCEDLTIKRQLVMFGESLFIFRPALETWLLQRPEVKTKLQSLRRKHTVCHWTRLTKKISFCFIAIFFCRYVRWESWAREWTFEVYGVGHWKPSLSSINGSALNCEKAWWILVFPGNFLANPTIRSRLRVQLDCGTPSSHLRKKRFLLDTHIWLIRPFH